MSAAVGVDHSAPHALTSTPGLVVDDPSDRRVSIGSLAGIVVVSVAALAIAVFVGRVQQAIGVTLAAACLALVTLPIQRALERVVGAVASMVMTALGTFAAVVTVGYIVLRDLGNQAEAIADLVRQRLDEVRPGSFPDRVATALELDTAIDEWLSRMPSIVVVGEEGGTQVGHRVVLLLAVVILAAFFQSSGRSILDWFVQRWPRDAPPSDASPDAPEPQSPRVTVREFLGDLERRGVGYVRRSLVLAGAVALSVWITCELCGMPGVVALAIWTGAWFVVPAVGWLVGLLPIAMLVALEQRPAAVVCLAVCAGLAALATRARRRLVEPATLRLGVTPYVMSVGFGVAIAGLGGSFVALVLGTMACAALTNSFRPGRPPGWQLDPQHSRSVGGITVPTGWRAALVVILMLSSGVLLWALLHRLAPAIAWLLIGGFVAVALSRPAAWIQRRTHLNRQPATALLLVVLGAILVAVTIAGLEDGARATTTATEKLPEVVAELEDAQVIGGWLRDRNASVWVEEQMQDLPQRLDQARPADWLPTVGARLVDLFWTALFAISFLLEGPRLLQAAQRRVPARHRRQYARITAATGTALAGYAAGAALIASINATAVFTIAIVLGVGLAPILAVWAFIWNFVPQIGGFMGGLPLILFALVAGPMRGLLAGLIYFAYQFIENHVIQPAVIGAAIDVAPWGTLIAALVGGAAAGVIGAVLITPLVGVVRVIRIELARDDFPGTTVRTEPTPSPEVAVT